MGTHIPSGLEGRERIRITSLVTPNEMHTGTMHYDGFRTGRPPVQGEWNGQFRRTSSRETDAGGNSQRRDDPRVSRADDVGVSSIGFSNALCALKASCVRTVHTARPIGVRGAG